MSDNAGKLSRFWRFYAGIPQVFVMAQDDRKKKDDLADAKERARKKDDEPDENSEKAGKKKGKGFFLFRPFRVFRTSSSAH